MTRSSLYALFVLALAPLPSPARAETQLCTPINSLPAVIASQGRYCLGKDLSTAISEGVAIQIAANNVTLDCNGYKLGGLGGGPASSATAIAGSGRQNTVIRGCTIRGFGNGIELLDDAPPYPGGLVVEGNRFDGVLMQAITVFGDASVVRDNLVADTGSGAGGGIAIAIRVEGQVDVIGNLVDGVAIGDEGQAYGIYTLTNARATIDGNRIRNIVSPGGAYGIHAEFESTALVLRGNTVADVPGTAGVAIGCNGPANIAMDNQVSGFATGIAGCTDGGDNVDY